MKTQVIETDHYIEVRNPIEPTQVRLLSIDTDFTTWRESDNRWRFGDDLALQLYDDFKWINPYTKQELGPEYWDSIDHKNYDYRPYPDNLEELTWCCVEKTFIPSYFFMPLAEKFQYVAMRKGGIYGTLRFSDSLWLALYGGEFEHVLIDRSQYYTCLIHYEATGVWKFPSPTVSTDYEDIRARLRERGR